MLLDKLQLTFEQISPAIDESVLTNETAESLVLRLAKAKAKIVAKSNPNCLIIASDQVALCQGVILGKPGDFDNAVKQLQRQSGQQVTFLTSIVLLNSINSQLQHKICRTEVTFRELTTAQINYYLKHDRPFSCAGSFKSESFGVTLFSKITSEDPDNLLGLPLLTLVEMLRTEGIDPLAKNCFSIEP